MCFFCTRILHQNFSENSRKRCFFLCFMVSQHQFWQGECSYVIMIRFRFDFIQGAKSILHHGAKLILHQILHQFAPGQNILDRGHVSSSNSFYGGKQQLWAMFSLYLGTQAAQLYEKWPWCKIWVQKKDIAKKNTLLVCFYLRLNYLKKLAKPSPQPRNLHSGEDSGYQVKVLRSWSRRNPAKPSPQDRNLHFSELFTMI